MTEIVDAPTTLGLGRWHVDRPGRPPVAVAALGHGAGGAVDSADLKVATLALVSAGVLTGRFEQPWRVSGRRVSPGGTQVDTAWCEALPALLSLPDPTVPRLPLLVGGRSAGARVACRTAHAVGALGVVALAFPLHPPGRPERSRAQELPTMPILVVQGGRDAFGSAEEVRASTSGVDRLTVCEVAGADHALRVRRSGPLTQGEVDEIVALAVRRWVLALLGGNLRR